jgi:hypothetical protein
MPADYPDDAVLSLTLAAARDIAREYADYAAFDHTHDACCVCEPTQVLMS